MNSDQSLQGYPGWRPPSPSSTPTSAKIPNQPFQQYQHHEQSPSFFDNAWMTPQAPSGQDMSHLSPVFTRTRPGQPSNQGTLKRPPPPSPTVVSSQQTIPEFNSPPMTAPLHYNQSFPSGSFLEQFNSHGISGDANAGPMMPPHTTPPTAMRTPPPTRDAGSRRKAQQPPLYQMTTPSTVVSRRMPASSDHGMTSASPYAFTPLQFSPPDPSHFLTNLGPMTAPTAQSTFFWDSYSPNPPPAQQSFPMLQHDDPFVTQPQQQSSTASFQRPSTSTSFGVSPRFGYGPPLQTEPNVQRPQSARPATAGGEESMHHGSFSFTSAGVDPSLLWTAPVVRSNIPATNSGVDVGISDANQPYQNQTEQLAREKRGRGRPRKDASKQALSSGPSTAKKPARPAIQRSFTDSRAVKTGAQRHSIIAHSSPSILPGLDTSDHLLRTSSPLKRHKSKRDSDLSSISTQFSLSNRRRSVALVIDKQGNAHTELKYIDEHGSPQRRQMSNADVFLDDSTEPSSHEGDGDDMDEDVHSNDLNAGSSIRSRPVSISSANHGIVESPAARNAMRYETAEDALREVIRKRREHRHG